MRWRSSIRAHRSGAAVVARQALRGLRSALPGAEIRPAVVNGAAGVVVTVGGRPVTVMGFTVAGGRIVEIDAIADPERVARLATTGFAGE